MRLRFTPILLVCLLLAAAPGCRVIAAAGVIALSALDEDDDSLIRSRDDERVCSPHRPRQVTRRTGATGRRP
ncbi:MAG: hypothetical protein ACYTGV_18730 [Planctomycetota bacterium]|jgi:hypothetical protein